MALPPGRFSTSGMYPSTFTGSPSSAMAATADSTAAAPAMSHFMSSICSLVLSDSPPLSKVTPLPTRPSVRPSLPLR